MTMKTLFDKCERDPKYPSSFFYFLPKEMQLENLNLRKLRKHGVLKFRKPIKP